MLQYCLTAYHGGLTIPSMYFTNQSHCGQVVEHLILREKAPCSIPSRGFYSHCVRAHTLLRCRMGAKVNWSMADVSIISRGCGLMRGPCTRVLFFCFVKSWCTRQIAVGCSLCVSDIGSVTLWSIIRRNGNLLC